MVVDNGQHPLANHYVCFVFMDPSSGCSMVNLPLAADKVHNVFLQHRRHYGQIHPAPGVHHYCLVVDLAIFVGQYACPAVRNQPQCRLSSSSICIASSVKIVEHIQQS